MHDNMLDCHQATQFGTGTSMCHHGLVVMVLCTSTLSGLVSAGMGDWSHLLVFNQPATSTHPFIGRCSEYWWLSRPLLEKNRHVYHRPCYQAWWHTDLVS